MKLIRIEGAKGMAVHFGRCCNPMPGQAIAGYVTKLPGITVHRVDCKSFATTVKDPKRVVEASWEGEGVFESTMRVIVRNRPNVLADITNALRPMNVDILRASLIPTAEGEGQFDFAFQARDERAIQSAERVLRTVPGVQRVTQMNVQERPTHLLPEAG